MRHTIIAATQGMKAGYNARKRVLRNSGLDTAQAALRESFGDYCAKFGPDVTAAQASLRNKPRSARVVNTEPSGLAEEILAARERLAELEAALVVESTPAPKRTRTTRKASATKENLWRSWAVAKHGIPTKVGATFDYKGKRRTSTFKVTRITDEGVFTKRV